MDANTTAIVIALVVAVPSTVAAIGTYLNGRAIRQVHVLTNSMSTKLNERTAQVSRQQGFEAGQANPKGLDKGRNKRRPPA